MNTLFPGKKKYSNMMEGTAWSSTTLNWKAKVVCEPCNNGWMSNIEEQHAKPAMTDLIAGKLDIPIPQSTATSIAIFAFKTAVVIEHLNKSRGGRFFPRQVRHRFRETLEIPPTVRTWLAGYLPRGQGRVMSIYHDLPDGSLELYVLTYAIGRFVFQLVAERKPSSLTFSPITGYEHLAVPFWPRIPDGFMWPAKAVLEKVKDFDLFAGRWQILHDVHKPLGG